MAKGWHLEDVLNGVRLWNHPLTVNRKVPLSPEASYQWNVLAATHKVELSPQVCVCVRVCACMGAHMQALCIYVCVSTCMYTVCAIFE